MGNKAEKNARGPDKRADGPKNSGHKWLSSGLLFGLLLLAGVIYLSMHLGEGREFLKVVVPADPVWLGVGVLSQAATYVCKGAVWWIVGKHFKVGINFGQPASLS